MKTPEQERLLHDVLHDEGYAAYRAELCERMLSAVRRERRWRRTRQSLALAACVSFALTLHWIVQHRHTSVSPSGRLAVIRTVPLKADQIVTTAGHAAGLTVVQSPNIELSSARFDVVRTIVELPTDTLTDEQLLELFKDRPVALVHSGSGKKLFFLDGAEPEFVNP